MSDGRQVNFFRVVAWLVPVLLLVASCTSPRKYQKLKPFVYKTNIDIVTNQPSTNKSELKAGLENQLDDSLKVRTVLALRWVPPFFYYRLSKPPLFDTQYVDRSKTFMTALLNANGYLTPIIDDTARIDTVNDQYRVTVDFKVMPGKVHRLDSVGFDLTTPELQALALQNIDATLLKKGDAYSLQKISAELDRLIGIYRDNGYYKISKEDIFVERDTIVAGLIDPTIDPFEQARLLEELQRRRENPTMTVVVKQRPPNDSSRIEKFYIGDVTVYPDLTLADDTMRFRRDTMGYRFFYNSNRFKLPFIARNISLRPGELYKQTNYFRTINTFTNLGAWQQVDIDVAERIDSVRLLDAIVRLYPAKKLSLNIDFETSRNASDALTTGSLFGLGFNIGVRNRNAFRESIETATNLRFGVELGKNIVQTAQLSGAHNIIIKRFLKPFQPKWKDLENPRTIININGAYTNRRDFFQVLSANASMRYDWSKGNNTWQLTLPFFNIELTDVIKTDSLRNLEDKIPNLRYAFNNGLIISDIIVGFTKQSLADRHINFYRARFESSGLIAGFYTTLERRNLRRFMKLDGEFKHFINYAKSTLAFRAFAGGGYIYGKTGDEPEYNLPFFKAFFAGGPYSMRAWQVRRLGPGSSSIYDTVVTDRFGDLQLEANIEYRFNLATIAGIKVKSALFVDMGNIWAKTFDRNKVVQDSAQFKLGRLYTDLAIGAGTSLRFDFDFFLIRLDWAYKIKNPRYAKEQNGWFHDIRLVDGQFQLGIGYPF